MSTPSPINLPKIKPEYQFLKRPLKELHEIRHIKFAALALINSGFRTAQILHTALEDQFHLVSVTTALGEACEEGLLFYQNVGNERVFHMRLKGRECLAAYCTLVSLMTKP